MSSPNKVSNGSPSIEEPRRSNLGIWSWGLVAAIAMTFLSLWPQFQLMWDRGSEWHGSFAQSNYDEDIYASYVNGLINGRPRRSDPLIESQNGVLPPESLFSIQFIQPVPLAAVATSFGISTSTVFIFLL